MNDDVSVTRSRDVSSFPEFSDSVLDGSKTNE